MKRHLRLLLTALVAGVLINVVIAWACAAWSPLRPFDSNYKHEIVVRCFPRNPGVDEVWYSPSAVRGGYGTVFMDGDYSYLHEREAANPDWEIENIRSMTARIWAGFPFFALETSIQHEHLIPIARGRSVVCDPPHSSDGILLANESITVWIFPFPRALPVRPRWAGFVANTMVFTALLLTPVIIRRLFRIRRRQCWACGYPIGSSAVCTECGQPIKASRRLIQNQP